MAHHKTEYPHFRIGVSEDRNKRCRRTMEDAHSFFYDFAGVKGQGFFAIFDGHAGKSAAEWCGNHFHETFKEVLDTNPNLPVPEIFHKAFLQADKQLNQNTAGKHSGCTAVSAFLRMEDDIKDGEGDDKGKKDIKEDIKGEKKEADNKNKNDDDVKEEKEHDKDKKCNIEEKEHDKGKKDDKEGKKEEEKGGIKEIKDTNGENSGVNGNEIANGIIEKKRKQKRVLYTANVGDARAVLSRNGVAVRLSYDHKGSDAQEAKRIVDAGGFVMNNRVNGVLAVTRSLGDSSMKEYVVGSPFTTETIITESDHFLILACDGLWDVCSDQNAVDLIKDIEDPQAASLKLIEHALQNFSTDNLSVMVIKFINE